ncbi:unnamed protein product [Urochloa humidicola]
MRPSPVHAAAAAFDSSCFVEDMTKRPVTPSLWPENNELKSSLGRCTEDAPILKESNKDLVRKQQWNVLR